MKTKFQRIATKDNLELHGLVYEPDTPTNKVILHVHGMAGNFYENGFLDYMAKTFTSNGYAFVAFNTRGHDFIADFRKTGIPEEKFERIGEVYENFEDCVLDIGAWMEFLQKNKYTEIILQGHSLGCVKVVFYQASKKDKRIKALVLASPPDMLGLVRKEKDFDEFISTAKKMKEQGKGKEILPKEVWGEYPITADAYLSLFGDDSKAAIFNIYKKKPTVLSKINIPILAFYGGKDDAVVFSPEKDINSIKSQATNCPKLDTFIVKDAPHSYFKHEQDVADKIIKWAKNLK